jgi:DNA-binding MarR family transcriptional regulator
MPACLYFGTFDPTAVPAPTSLPTSSPARSADEPPIALDQAWLLGNVGYLCTRIASQVKRDFAAQTQDSDLTAVEFSILTLLHANGAINQKQLCQALDISPSRAAVILDRLEGRSLVRRVRGTEDRRETYLHLSAAGRSAFDRARAGAQAADASACEVLTVGERHILLELLQKVARARR